MARIEEGLAPYRRAECLLVAAGFGLSEIRSASLGEVEGWIKALREATPAAPRPPAGPATPAAPVKKLSKRFLEQQQMKKGR